jgi:hypothetical protein
VGGGDRGVRKENEREAPVTARPRRAIRVSLSSGDFLWECLTNRTVNGFQPPATSHVVWEFSRRAHLAMYAILLFAYPNAYPMSGEWTHIDVPCRQARTENTWIWR